MTKIKLYTTFYNEKDEARKKEFLKCIQNNADNPSIDFVTVFNEGDTIDYMESEKIKTIKIAKRPTYNDFIININKRNLAMKSEMIDLLVLIF